MSQGIVRRKDKEMSRAEVDDLLARSALAHFATVGADGQPYVVPNLFVYAEGKIFLHTTTASGHFKTNVEANPRISFTVAEMGTVFPYGEFECDTTVSYASAVGFGMLRIETDRAKKSLFFDRFMTKYADPKWQQDRPKGFYPRLDEVTIYVIEVERLTGKKGPLPGLSDQWPAKNLTKSPGVKPPAKSSEGH
jgi:nitroimidazol reductase NimA-like FMN-containing flavoprotein (pyridoxamine 5'-phosphate oxidase superfamily)